VRARIEPPEAARWLREAPQVAEHKAAFYWTCLDRPADGSTYLVWQPLQRCGIQAASDGYVWTAPEQHFQQDLGNGTVLEMYWMRAGYALGDPVASHARRRFRLISAPGAQGPPVNPSLWLVHWGAADPADRLPASQHPPPPKLLRALEAHSPLRLLSRKDFMLRDHAHWPTITRDNIPQAPPQMSMPRIPPQMAYQPPGGGGGGGAPPQQGGPAAHTQVQFAPAPAPAPAQRKTRGQQVAPELDDEDVRGDFFDAIAPREIALERYKRSHDWIEEVVASHYSMSQIIPPDLGLEMTVPDPRLTDGITRDPSGIDKQRPPTNMFRPGARAELQKRVDDFVAETERELAVMEAKHRRDLEALTGGSLFKRAERMLRDEHGRLDEAVALVEAGTGRKVEEIADARMVEPGGWTRATNALGRFLSEGPEDLMDEDDRRGILGLAPPGTVFPEYSPVPSEAGGEGGGESVPQGAAQGASRGGPPQGVPGQPMSGGGWRDFGHCV
jgi:hypothetical protein